MNTLLKKVTLTTSAYFLPLVAFGANAEITTLAAFFAAIEGIINSIIPFIVGLAVFIIIWGVFTYIAGAGDEEKRAQAKSFIVWGVVGVFIMLSIWGLVNILAGTLRLKKNDQGLVYPTFGGDAGPGPTGTGTLEEVFE